VSLVVAAIVVVALMVVLQRLSAIVNQLADAETRLQRLESAFSDLRRRVAASESSRAATTASTVEPPAQTQPPAPSTTPRPPSPPIAAPRATSPPLATPPSIETPAATASSTARQPAAAANAAAPARAASTTAGPAPSLTLPAGPAPPHPTDDFEAEIGSRWLLLTGIVVLVLGVAFFVKYAFDNRLIGETARVAIGTAAGIAAWLLGLRLALRGFTLYGRIVAGGGLAMIYLAAYAASALYGLVPAAVAFTWMAVASAATAITADRQRSVGLALTAIVLAYATPFLIPSAREQHLTLFVFDALLAAASLVLVQRHRWPALGPVSMWLTWTSYAAWYAQSYRTEWFVSTEAYLTAIAAIFALMLREYRRANALPTAAHAPANGLAGAVSPRNRSVAFSLLARWSVPALVLAVGPALYYVASVQVLFDHSLWLLVYFIAFTASAIALAGDHAPLRLLVWAAVALPFLAWSDRHVLTAWYVATIATAVAIYLLHLAAQVRVLDGATSAADPELALFHANGLGLFSFTYLAVANRSGSTAALAALLAAANAALAFVTRRRVPVMPPHALALSFAFTATAISLALSGAWISVAWAAEGAAVIWIGLRLRRTHLRSGGALLLALATMRLVALQFAQTLVTFTPILNSRTGAGAFIVALMYATAVLHRRYGDATDRNKAATAWIVAANLLTVGLLTADVNSFWRLRAEDVRASFARQLSVSLTWGTYAMGLIAIGFRRGSTPLRYLALAIFGVTVAKMFAVDLLELSGIYRITGFIVLGIVLLVASFLYQKRGA
jgi:uncharacterized membrane protein